MADQQTEQELGAISERYQRRLASDLDEIYTKHFLNTHYMRAEREAAYAIFIQKHFKAATNLSILEIGAGLGDNLYFFRRIGVPWMSITANEFLPDRIEFLKAEFPQANLISGDARSIKVNNQFDIVFQSTVFTSIHNREFKNELAKKMWQLTKPGGICLWYDFKVNNPKNPDVKGVSRRQILELFPSARQIKFKSVTLAPPIGRRIGRAYNLANTLLPFLRTHMVAAIYKSN